MEVGTQSISPLFWAIESGALNSARAMSLGRQRSSSGEASVVVAFFATSSFLFLVARPGAPSSVLAPSSEALCS